MKISLRMFSFAMVFGLVVCGAYWFDTGDSAGTIFLGLMGLGFFWVLLYLFATRKSTQYDGDQERRPSELAGEHIAVVSSESPWPILLAIATSSFLIGTVLHPMLGFFAVICFFIVAWQLAREST
jgi:hypothetical protein